MTKAADRLERIQGQIVEAQDETDQLTEQIEAVDKQLTNELAKASLNEEKMTDLENQRETLLKSRARLVARVEALSKTIPDNERLVAKASLKAAIAEHGQAVDQVNEALESYRTEGLQLLRTFVGIYHSLIDKRLAAEALRDKAAYYSALLGLERPKLKTANSLTREEDTDLSREIHNCIPMRADPYRTSEYSEKLRILNREKKEAEQAKAEIENRRVSQLAG